MSKDPAFLFYTKDFQSGTQDMSCEEVGMYLRLLMYQHQHGSIPNDTERMMRITGIFDISKFEELWTIVGLKFVTKKDGQALNQMVNHLVNERLTEETTKRLTAKPKKIAAAVLAGLISANKGLSKTQVFEIKKAFNINDFTEFSEEEIKFKIKEWFLEMVNQMVNNLANANANANANVNVNKGKGGVGEKPNLSDFDFPDFTESLTLPEKWKKETFRPAWDEWKRHLFEAHAGEHYRSLRSEQAAIEELFRISSGDMRKAMQTINFCIARQYKAIYEDKNKNNGTKRFDSRRFTPLTDAEQRADRP